MMRQAHLGSSKLWLLLGALAIASTTTGCELVASVDRTLIGEGGGTATGPRGILGGYADGRVYGWAFIADQTEPVRVRIEVEGEPVRFPYADEPRDDLVEAGVHPTGDVGFDVEIGEHPSGAEIRAYINNAYPSDPFHWELDGSPITVP